MIGKIFSGGGKPPTALSGGGKPPTGSLRRVEEPQTMSSSPILADSLPVPAVSSWSHRILLHPHHPSPMDAAVPRSVYNPPHPSDAWRFKPNG